MKKSDKIWFVVGFIIMSSGIIGFMSTSNFLNFITIGLGMSRCILSFMETMTKNIEMKRLVDSDPDHYHLESKRK